MNYLHKDTIKIIAIIVFSIAIFSCKKKKGVEVDTSAIICKTLKLTGQSYLKIADISCVGNSKTGTISISCKYDGDPACIKRIRLNAKFYTSASIEIPNIQYPTVFEIGDSRIGITKDSIKFKFEYTLPTSADPKTLSFVYVNYYSESESGDVSTRAQLRINSNCSKIDSSTYDVVKTYKFTSDTLQVTVYDAVKEDGDQISLWLNDILRLDNFVLKKTPTVFKYKLNVGKNRLVLFAITEGGVGSNTPAIAINSYGNINMLPTLTKGGAIDIYYTPIP